jgi:hypothetical protein
LSRRDGNTPNVFVVDADVRAEKKRVPGNAEPRAPIRVQVLHKQSRDWLPKSIGLEKFIQPVADVLRNVYFICIFVHYVHQSIDI